jgi:hypothetical protein
MTIELSNEEKINIIESKIRFINEQVYNYDIEIQMENSKDNPDQAQLDAYSSYLSDVTNKLDFLNSTLTALKN